MTPETMETVVQTPEPEEGGGRWRRRVLVGISVLCLLSLGYSAGASAEDPKQEAPPQNKLDNLREENSDLSDEIDYLRDENSDLTEQVNSLQDDNADLEQENADPKDAAEQPAPASKPKPESAPEPAPEPKPVPKPDSKFVVGEKAKAGQMTWIVDNAYRTTALEDIYGIEPPKRGNFVVVEFRFTNGSNESITLDPTFHMELKDGQGRTYDADTDTFSYIPSHKDIFLNQVNPGVMQQGMVIFTVAPNSNSYKFIADDVEFWEDDPAKISLGV